MEVIADAKRYNTKDREVICLFETSKQLGGFAFLQDGSGMWGCGGRWEGCGKYEVEVRVGR